MKKVITYGTFDTFHFGHWNLLKRASKLGDYLIVAVSTDKFNLLKGKKSFLSFRKRKEIIQSLDFVDKVIPEKYWEQKTKDIKDNKIDIFVMGDDWKGKFDNLDCEVIYLKRTPKINSAKIKKICQD